MGYPLYSIEVVKNIQNLNLEGKGINTLPDLKALKNLKIININNNNLTTLNIVHPSLEILNCNLNNIKSINLKTPKLKKLYATMNNLKKITIEACPEQLHLQGSKTELFYLSDDSQVNTFVGNRDNKFQITEHNRKLFEKFKIPYNLIETSNLTDL